MYPQRVLTALVLTLVTAGISHCGFVTQSGVRGSWISGAAGQTEEQAHFSNFWNIGSSSSAAGSIGNSGASASVGVTHGLFLNPGIHLSGISGISAVSETYSAGQWIDVIRVGGGTAPNKVRVLVEVEGFIHLDLANGRQALAEIGVVNLPGATLVGNSELGPIPAINFGGANPSDVRISLAAPLIPGVGPSLTIQDNNTYNLTLPSLLGGIYSDAISWHTYIDLPYQADIGGYQLNLYAATKTLSDRGTTASADLSHTIRIAGISQVDGSTIEGAVSFDSGFRVIPPDVNAVPEPGSAVLLAIGAAIVGVGGRARRSRVR